LLHGILKYWNNGKSVLFEYSRIFLNCPENKFMEVMGNHPTTTEEKIETTISTMDGKSGLTIDQMRMYRRSIGMEGDLLTREGEIEIVKRIEGGLMDMMMAISASPATIAEILVMASEVRSGKMRIWDVVDSFVDDERDYYALEEFTNEAFLRFEVIATEFECLHQAHAAGGYGSPDYQRAQQALTQKLMTIRFTTKAIKKLRDALRAQVADVRKKEWDLHRIMVDKCGMPKKQFATEFLPNLLNRKWVEQQAAASKPWSAVLERSIPQVQELQQHLIDLQKKVFVPLDELKRINKRVNDGERASRSARTEMFEINKYLIIFMAKKYINKGVPLTEAELIQACNKSLKNAVNRLAYCKNLDEKFSEHLTWYMRQAMLRAVCNKMRGNRCRI